ncbi:hypothetical protein [Synechococcus sp. MIT S9508]|uniref:hypothetical protein n=1 Tax=Synechococcus sp. MIT S9508 TaxID=1801629 RepID=UPI001E3BFCAC|nr:hypothetical protein [Synechococcus sp. MIT S9508]
MLNDQQGNVCSFTNDSPTPHGQWVIVQTRALRGSSQPVIRPILRHNAIEVCETMQKLDGWKRCQPR